ncbi:hypothetical protein FRX31_017482 [Thalictrum thalictroides]|uniref:Uncharacterized protein n=1 Tax=Thalictrum thalictroides TaxID=46969 RepID=A0A7J6W6S6_THATH|nr:hypothetical protein FRX31_017482 [Thalictrum thalictroides]
MGWVRITIVLESGGITVFVSLFYSKDELFQLIIHPSLSRTGITRTLITQTARNQPSTATATAT